MSADSSRAVFLSYASQDAEAARRIGEALRAAGVEVWFDQNELVGGDAWDAKIRRQIAECALFLPVISANTQARLEGYFRIEWNLAAQRTHAMASAKPFLLPVVVDRTPEPEAHVPEEFRRVQWTRSPQGDLPLAFVDRVRAVLTGAVPAPSAARDGTTRGAAETRRPRPRAPYAGIAGALVLAGAALVWWRLQPEVPANARESRRLVAEVWTQLDRIHLDPPMLATAADLARRATTLDPLNADAWAAWSQVDSWQGYMQYDASPARIESARANAAHALQLAPTAFEARLAQAVYLVRAHGEVALPPSPRQAQELLAGLLQEKPEDPRALLTAAILERNLHHWPEARALFLRLTRVPGYEASAWAELGYAEDRAGDPAAAEAAADRSIALQPASTNLTLKLYLALARGDLDAAEATLDRMPAEIAEEDKVVSIACEIEHQRRDAPGMLKRLAPVTRDWLHSVDFDGPTAFWTGLAQQLAGRADAAQFHWQLALKLVNARLDDNPTSGGLMAWRGVLQALLGNAAEAEKTLALAAGMKTGPREGPRNAVVAYAHARDGRLDDAIQLITAHPIEFRPGSAYVRLDPFLDPLRADPRFQALVGSAADAPAVPARAMGSADGPAAVEPKSVAVLAFADESPAHDSEYFSDGISEELINTLGKVSGLKVPARTSSFYFKGRNAPVAEIARQLGVAYVVEGSVQRIADKVKIGARLTKAADGYQVWTDSFVRDAKDVFAVEEEIAGLVAKQLSLKLGATSAAARAPVNPEAFDLYLQANARMRLRDTRFFDTSAVEVLLTRALALEPGFERAQALLTELWASRASFLTYTHGRFDQRNSEAQAKLEAKARHAVELDPDSAEAHDALGIVFWYAWKRAEAEQEFRRAIAANPNDADGYVWLAHAQMDDGRMDESLATMQMAMQLDPLSQNVIESEGRALHLAGRFTEALAMYDRALAMADSIVAREHKAYVLAQLGRTQEAWAVARGLPPDQRVRPYAAIGLAAVTAAGAREEFEAALTQSGENRPYLLLLAGRTEDGLNALDSAAALSTWLHDWLFEPWMAPVRNDPRFKRYIDAIGATAAHGRAQAWRAAHPVETAARKT